MTHRQEDTIEKEDSVEKEETLRQMEEETEKETTTDHMKEKETEKDQIGGKNKGQWKKISDHMKHLKDTGEGTLKQRGSTDKGKEIAQIEVKTEKETDIPPGQEDTEKETIPGQEDTMTEASEARAETGTPGKQCHRTRET